VLISCHSCRENLQAQKVGARGWGNKKTQENTITTREIGRTRTQQVTKEQGMER